MLEWLFRFFTPKSGVDFRIAFRRRQRAICMAYM